MMYKIFVVLIFVAAVGFVVLAKQKSKSEVFNPIDHTKQATTRAVVSTKAVLPRLLDLGAGKCIPCKMMKPILEELKKEYQGRLEVDFIDVWENYEEGVKHKINIIPTQIFFDGGGKELYRHEGFFSKEDILAKWKELGVDLK